MNNFDKDSLNKSEVESEIMSLMIKPEKKQSLFAGLKKIKSDSTMVADASKGVYSFPDTTLKVREVVEKNQGKKFFYTANHMPDKVYKVDDSRPMNWKIT